MRKTLLCLVAWGLISLTTSAAHAIAISIDSPLGGTLQDSVLFATTEKTTPLSIKTLNDIDLKQTNHIIDVAIEAETTHWWLWGRQDTTFVYSSVQDLTGIDYLDVEPFNDLDIGMLDPITLVQNINSGTAPPPTFDQAIFIALNHSSHMAADGAAASLWAFASPGVDFGVAAVSLHDDIPPGLPQIPVPAALWLFGSGLVGLIGIARRKNTA